MCFSVVQRVRVFGVLPLIIEFPFDYTGRFQVRVLLVRDRYLFPSDVTWSIIFKRAVLEFLLVKHSTRTRP